jgi:hypothetical protein
LIAQFKIKMNKSLRFLLLIAIFNLIVKELTATNTTASSLSTIVPKNDTINDFNSTLAARYKRCKSKIHL